jgi:uncharacterized membrane protein
VAPYNRKPLVRFHSVQALLLWGVSLVIYYGIAFTAGVLPMLLLGGNLLISAWRIVAFLAAVFCAAKAYNHEMFALPVIGDVARRQSLQT